MRVLYDSVGLQESVGGVSRYFVEMTKRLPADIEAVFSAVETRNAYLAATGIPRAEYGYENFLPGVRLPSKYRVYRWASRWFHGLVPGSEETNLRAFKSRLDEGGWDLVHLTSPHRMGRELAWVRKAGVPYVITVHDLIPELIESSVPRRFGWRTEALEGAAGIVAVSANTKNDLVRIYGVASERIQVVHHGASTGATATSDAALDLPSDYVLFVGKRGGYKNFDWMAEALKPLEAEGIQLVATGGERHYTDAELRALYRGARCLVYPSKYEGFGLPILEAWREGCPVVLSRASCFPEIGGEAALYFDLGDAEGLRRLVKGVGSRDEGVGSREDLVKRGYERLKIFSWEKVAAETAEIYRRAVR